MQPVDPATLAALPQLIGPDRFGPYLHAQAGVPAEAIRLYSWNVEASAALLGSYAALEVGVRNAMHDQLTAMFARQDWWVRAPLDVNDLDEVHEAEEQLDRRRGPGQWTAGHVVAELRASFWEGLLANKYHASLWERGLPSAFPHYTGRRGDLRSRMDRLRLLRNRAAHHEPIFDRDLRIDHRFMCELASFISADLSTWISTHSRLPGVFAARPQTVAGQRPTRF